MRNIDFSSWQGLFSTLVGLCVVTLVMVGIRLVVMQTVQQRRERANRQINERLRTLIAAYKTLGGSFTGNLAVDPAHRRDRLRAAADAVDGGVADAADAADEAEAAGVEATAAGATVVEAGAVAASAMPARGTASTASTDGESPGAERRRRVRDAVEAALSDVVLLGTEAQVRLAAHAAGELVAGREVETAELVVSLRDFIREVLDLEPMPSDVVLPRQGPARPAAGGTRGGARGEGGREGRGGGGGGGGGGGAASGGGGAAFGLGAGAGLGGTAAHGAGAASHEGPDDAVPR